MEQLSPLGHNYLAHTSWEDPTPTACALQQERPPQWVAHALQPRVAPHSLQLEKAPEHQQRPSAAKNENKYFLNIANKIQKHTMFKYLWKITG